MRVPVSWLIEVLATDLAGADLVGAGHTNAGLGTGLTARQVDDLLGEAGVTVAGVEAIGARSPGIVAARMKVPEARCADGTATRVEVSLPTPELADLPAGAPAPRPGTMVAVALPGATLFAPMGSRLVRVPPAGRAGQAIGRVCTAAELGIAGRKGILTLAPDVRPGTPVASLFPDGGELVLTLRIPDTLPHCQSLSGLAREIRNRLGRPAQPAVGQPGSAEGWRAALALRVTVPDLAACTVLLPVPVGRPCAVIDWHRPALAGLNADTVLDRALLVAAFEHGARLSAHFLPAVGPVEVSVGPGAQIAPRPLQSPPADSPARLLVLATAPADLVGSAGCQRAAERAARLLFPGGLDTPVPTVLARGPEAERRRVALDPAWVTARAGLAVGAVRCRDLLAIIGARAAVTPDDRLIVAIPPSRPDLGSAESLAAELIRLIGPSALPATVPADPVQPRYDRRYDRLAAVRRALAGCRFHEVITPLADSAQYGGVPGTPWTAGAVPLADAAQGGVSAGDRWLRRSLVPAIVRTALGQVPPGALDRLYELGTAIVPGPEGAAERCFLTIARCTRVALAGPWPTDWEADYWDVLDSVREAVLAFDAGDLSANAIDDSRFYPGTGALLTVAGRAVGHLGALRLDALCGTGPGAAEGTAAASGPAAGGHSAGNAALALLATGHVRVVAAELDLEAMLGLPRRPRALAVPPQFPVMERDVSLLLPDDVAAQQVMDAVGEAGPLLRGAAIRDVYRDPRDPGAPRVMTVRLTLGSPHRTLGKREAADAVERARVAAKGAGALPQ